MICDSCPPADSGAFGLATRWMLSQASLAVTVFPLWKVTPGRILIVQVFASLEGSTDSARAGSSWKSLFQNSSGSYRLHTRAMSAACTGWCGSRVSLLPPPVAPWIRVPPDFCAPPSPPPPLPLSPPSSPPPHAARKLLPATAAMTAEAGAVATVARRNQAAGSRNIGGGSARVNDRRRAVTRL